MKRRKALKLVTLSVGSLFALPAWANGWSTQHLDHQKSLFDPEFDALLAEIVDTFIPQTDTPGAKTLGVHTLMQLVATDCYDQPTRDKFAAAVRSVDEHAQTNFVKNFRSCDAAQRLAVLQSMEVAPNTSEAFKMLKKLCTDGYMKSEYALENILKFEFAPARFHGCVPQ